MQVTVFGANGKVGQLVVRGLLDRGHSVVAFVHEKNSLPTHSKLGIQKGDIHSSDDIAKAIERSEAVVSVLSSWQAPGKDVLSAAMQRLIPAMRAQNISRVISLTGAIAFDSKDRVGILDNVQHALLNAVSPKVLRDAEDHLRLLRDSGLKWTVVRSPLMVKFGSPAYKLQNVFPAPWATIHYQAVAECIINLVETSEYAQQAPVITRA